MAVDAGAAPVLFALGVYGSAVALSRFRNRELSALLLAIVCVLLAVASVVCFLLIARYLVGSTSRGRRVLAGALAALLPLGAGGLMLAHNAEGIAILGGGWSLRLCWRR